MRVGISGIRIMVANVAGVSLSIESMDVTGYIALGFGGRYLGFGGRVLMMENPNG